MSSIPLVIGSVASDRQSTVKDPITSRSFFRCTAFIMSHRCRVERVRRETSVVTIVSPGATISISFINSARSVFVPDSYSQ